MGLSENRLNPNQPNGFADHYPYFTKWLFHWGYTPFSDITIYKNNDHSTLNVPSLNVSTPSHSIQSQSIPLNFAASAPTAVFPPPTQSVVKVPAHAGLHRVKGNDASDFHQEMNLVISTHSMQSIGVSSC